MTSAVNRRARDDHWSESGKKAFITTRVTPYCHALDEAAGNYDGLEFTMKTIAVAFTLVGLTSATVGSAMLTAVASGALAGVAAPEIGIIANIRVTEAGEAFLSALRGLAGINGKVASFLWQIIARQELSKSAILKLTLLSAGSVTFESSAAPPMLRRSVDAVDWPRELPAKSAAPAGFQTATPAQQSAMRKISPDSIVALGKDIDAISSETLGMACDEASRLDVGIPGFGVYGIPVARAFDKMRKKAADQLAAARDTPGSWFPGLRTSAGNWVFAEQDNAHAIRRVR